MHSFCGPPLKKCLAQCRLKDLGLRFDKITYTSDYFPQLLEIGEKLIKAGLMYADDTPVEQMREVGGGHHGRSMKVSTAG